MNRCSAARSCPGPVRVVKGEDALVPARAGQPVGLLRLQARPGSDDEHVVRKPASVAEQHPVPVEIDRRNFGLVKEDAVAQLPPARSHDLVARCEAEGDEEQTGLVDVTIVPVDHVDLRLVRPVTPPEPIRGHGAAGAAAEDDDLLLAHEGLSVAINGRVPPSSQRLIVSETVSVKLMLLQAWAPRCRCASAACRIGACGELR